MDISGLYSKSLSAIKSAQGGDLRPLTRLLRSKEKLDQSLRNYLAEEIEKPAGKRFRRFGREDINRRKNDQKLLFRVFCAKVTIAERLLGLEEANDEQALEAGLTDAAEKVTDAEALRFLFDECHVDISPSHLNNVRNRNREGSWNRRISRERQS